MCQWKKTKKTKKTMSARKRWHWFKSNACWVLRQTINLVWPNVSSVKRLCFLLWVVDASTYRNIMMKSWKHWLKIWRIIILLELPCCLITSSKAKVVLCLVSNLSVDSYNPFVFLSSQKRYRCQHNTLPKTKEQNKKRKQSSKNTNCSAKMTITVKNAHTSEGKLCR